MKIFGIGRNYVDHIEELNNERPKEPVVFFKPDTALLINNRPFYFPDFSKEIHHEVEIVIKISRTGKYVEERFAYKYFDEIGLGIDFTARDLQSIAKEKGLPWTLAKGFNQSAPVSKFLPKKDFKNINDLNFGLEIDGKVKQEGNTKLMIYNFDFIISHLSKYFILKKGDLVFTGTPAGVGPVKIGNRLVGHIEDKTLLDFEIK